MSEELQILEDQIAVVISRLNKLKAENANLKTENARLNQLLQNSQMTEDRIAVLNTRLAEQEAVNEDFIKKDKRLKQIIAQLSEHLKLIETDINAAAAAYHDDIFSA